MEGGIGSLLAFLRVDMAKIITAKAWKELLEKEGFDKLLKSLEVGIRVFRSDFLEDSPFAELDDMDKLDIQEFVLGMAKDLVNAAVEINQCMTEQQAESKAHL